MALPNSTCHEGRIRCARILLAPAIIRTKINEDVASESTRLFKKIATDRTQLLFLPEDPHQAATDFSSE